MSSGFYADMDYNCKIFHVCDNAGNGFPVICFNNTIFNQKQRICSDEEDVDCLRAHEWYYLNALTYSAEIEMKSVMEEIKYENESKTIEEEIPSVLPLLVD
ncbi:uncharacterized protein LOC109853550 [Pseudomyrmex gracilis]|uniref:uncharacterized protein LOC109853550 n=1 Tax=Pseudomyrmex gracilis TaxID=219809 RepID=UPI00099505E1|nr:uncharacterized protein LOC109853550 [Pseudomyrmex gracilis]